MNLEKDKMFLASNQHCRFIRQGATSSGLDEGNSCVVDRLRVIRQIWAVNFSELFMVGREVGFFYYVIKAFIVPSVDVI